MLALLVIAFPAYTQLGRSVTNRLAGVPLREHIRAERDNILGGLRQAALSMVVLAHQSAVMVDAIVRTLRMLVTRRNMLQWVTSDRAVMPSSGGHVFDRMWVAPLVAFVATQLVVMTAPGRLLVAAPVLALWFLSPLLVYITGLPLEASPSAAQPEQRAALRRTARRPGGSSRSC